MNAVRATRRLLVAALALAALVGCYPEQQTRVPEIEGRVTRAGAGVAGAIVTVTRTFNRCSPVVQCTTTDRQGRFLVHPVREWGIARVFVSPELAYTVCLDMGKGPQLAYVRRGWGGPAAQTMTCDVDTLPGSTESPACTEAARR